MIGTGNEINNLHAMTQTMERCILLFQVEDESVRLSFNMHIDQATIALVSITTVNSERRN